MAPLGAKQYLSKFQIDKLSYMFNAFFDVHGGDGVVEKADIEEVLEKLRKYCGYLKSDPKYLQMNDVMFAFYNSMVDQVRKEKMCSGEAEGYKSWEEARKTHTVTNLDITLNDWLNMWGKLCRGSAGISGFPIWVKLLCQIFFETIDRDQDGNVNEKELRNFYEGLIEVPKADLDKVTKEGYRAMTADGRYKLTKDNYEFCFANFLLGKGIYGPGKYIFGVFDNSDIDMTYKVIYN
jgi:hypothetical protein